MAVVSLQEILEAFFWSGILSLGMFMVMAFADLTQAILSLTRFSAFAFEPNVLAFVLAGYFCAVVWKFMTGGWCRRVFAGLVGFACLAIIFFASSRGSLVAVLVGCLFVAGMKGLGGSKERRQRFLGLGLLTSALLLGVVFAAQSRGWTGDTFNFVDQVLALSTPDRGIDSGFTGRFDKWKETLRALSDGTWLTGRGLRSSDSMYPPIDNSYLVLLYEVGLFPLVLITWRFFGILRRFVRSYFRSTNERQRHFYLAWTLLMVVFLVNDIVGRFMFALANPYSLLAFLIFAAPGAEMEVYSISSTRDLRLSKGVVNWGDTQQSS
jgi:hypothetical protein